MKISANGKIRRTEGEWREILGRFAGSGCSQSEFCIREKISLPSFHKWRHKLSVGVVSSFVEVGEVSKAKTSAVELMFPSGLVLRIGS